MHSPGATSSPDLPRVPEEVRGFPIDTARAGLTESIRTC